MNTDFNLNKPCHVHFMGIGGISMSGLAELLADKGFTVSGSDINRSPITEKLEAMGIKVIYEQAASNITPDIDFLIYTAAIHDDNPEFSEAVKNNIPMLTRAELLGLVMDGYTDSVAISGTHGKTTVTGMISQIFLQAGNDPCISIGGILPVINSNFKKGTSDIFIAEACEYKNSFLSLKPKYSVILNVEADHLDFFKDLSDIRHSFAHFAANTSPDGALIINGDITDTGELTKDCRAKVITYGINPGCDYHAANKSTDAQGLPEFDLYHGDELLLHIKLSVYGEHNISNAVSAAALALNAGIKPEDIQTALSLFTGAKRRFEKKGSFNGITVIDDYAHHPTEIAATLSAARALPFKRIVCTFQSHTYSRTKALLKDFAKALSMADVVVLPDIYPAREAFDPTISSDSIRQELEKLGTESYYTGSFEETEKFLLKKCIDGDLLITMGAGNVVDIGEHLLSM